MLRLQARVDLEQWLWRGTPHSLKFQDYWNLIIRLFYVISWTLVWRALYPQHRNSWCILQPHLIRLCVWDTLKTICAPVILLHINSMSQRFCNILVVRPWLRSVCQVTEESFNCPLELWNTPTSFPKRGKTPSNEPLEYGTKQIWGIRSTPSLRSLPAPLWLGVVAPDRVLSMGQIELNCVLMRN